MGRLKTLDEIFKEGITIEVVDGENQRIYQSIKEAWDREVGCPARSCDFRGTRAEVQAHTAQVEEFMQRWDAEVL